MRPDRVNGNNSGKICEPTGDRLSTKKFPYGEPTGELRPWLPRAAGNRIIGIWGWGPPGRVFLGFCAICTKTGLSLCKICQLTFFENSGIIDHCRPAEMGLSIIKMQRVLKTLRTLSDCFIPSIIPNEEIDCKEKYYIEHWTHKVNYHMNPTH